MTAQDTTKAASGIDLQPKRAGLLESLEIDTRLLGMIGALIVIWVGFDLATNGLFITPRNLFNLSVQTASVAVMATGMVLVIVTRNIDLSVGSLVGVLAMVMGVVQAEILPELWGFDHPATWAVALLVGLALGAAIGALQGSIISFLDVPAFIVTLGGFLVWRGGAWWITQGRTVAPLDVRYQLMGGGIDGSIGAVWSWGLAAIAVVLVVAAAIAARRRRQRFGFPVKPLWAEYAVSGMAVAAIVGFVATMNAYPHPERRAALELVDTISTELATDGLQGETAATVASLPDELKALAEDPQTNRRALIRGLQSWEGLPRAAHGIALPVLVVAIVVLLMHFLATRTRFGRYVFAIGGNPEAAQLAGVNTKKVLLTVFVTMGMLCAIAAAIASARLQAAGNDLGTLDELRVIAAAVIGGTALAGGMGTIAGAVLGALVMQSLQSGMALVGINSSLQSMIIGAVLVLAVWLDAAYQKRRK